MSRSFAVRAVLAVAMFGTLVLASAPAHAQNLGLGVVSQEQATPRFYGFSFDFTVADGSGLNAVGENYRNDLAFYFEPTWNFGRLFFPKSKHWSGLHLAARFIVTQNLSGVDDSGFSGQTNANPQGTCSNITPSQNGGVVDPTQVGYCYPPSAQRRTDYSDVWLTLRAPRVYTIPKLGININPSIRFILPASAQSRYQTMIMSITGFLGFSKGFWKGKIRTGYTFGFNKYFYENTTAGIVYSNGQSSGAQGGNPYDGAIGVGYSNFLADPSRAGPLGGTNTNFSLQNILSIGFQLHEKVGLDLLYITINSYGYDQPCTVNVQGQTVDTCVTGNAVAGASGSFLNRPGRRDTQVLWLGLTYTPVDYMTLTLSYYNAAPMYYPNSTYRQGIWSSDYNAFSTVQLGATVSLEPLAERIWKRK